MNLVVGTPAAADVRTALRLAKCLSLVDSEGAGCRHEAVSTINNTYFFEPTITLLSFVAGYKLLNRFTQDPTLQNETSHGLERLASSLRVWMGHGTGRRSGLSNKIRSRIVSRCLETTKTLVGLADREDVDPGYFSSSVKGEEASP